MRTGYVPRIIHINLPLEDARLIVDSSEGLYYREQRKEHVDLYNKQVPEDDTN